DRHDSGAQSGSQDGAAETNPSESIRAGGRHRACGGVFGFGRSALYYGTGFNRGWWNGDVNMEEKIYPRSPREMMCGWVYLPRFIDKIRLKEAGKLAPDYQENFTKAFDGLWLKAAGLSADAFLAVVRGTITDGEV